MDEYELDIHKWFDLSCAHYLTIPRSVLQSMPKKWQQTFVECLIDLDESIDWRPLPKTRYMVRLCVVGEEWSEEDGRKYMTDKTKTPFDWEKVKEEVQTAYLEWRLGTPIDETNPFVDSILRAPLRDELGHLLAFFDERGIWINIVITGPSLWQARIELGNSPNNWEGHDEYGPIRYDSRSQAFAAAFTEAFKLLEEKLQNEN